MQEARRLRNKYKTITMILTVKTNKSYKTAADCGDYLCTLKYWSVVSALVQYCLFYLMSLYSLAVVIVYGAVVAKIVSIYSSA